MTDRKTCAAFAAAILLASGAAMAQQNAPTPSSPATTGAVSGAAELREVDGDDRMVQPWNLPVDRVEDMNVTSPTGQRLGEVDEVLEDASGQIRAIVVEVDVPNGRDRDVIVALDQLTLQADRLQTGLTAEQLLSMPQWED
jgi:hypothetical protein